MTSGLEMPDHEHEEMFFTADHLEYARSVALRKPAGQSLSTTMSIQCCWPIFAACNRCGRRLFAASGYSNKIGLTDVTLWRDQCRQSSDLLLY